MSSGSCHGRQFLSFLVSFGVVKARRTWPRAVSPFVWNHHPVMRQGGEGLARLLGAELISAPAALTTVATVVRYPRGHRDVPARHLQGMCRVPVRTARCAGLW